MSEVDVCDLSAATIGHQLGELQALSLFGPLRDPELKLNFQLRNKPEPMASAVFAQAMLVVRQDVHLIVHLPEEDAMLTALIRAGVGSALARRRERISYEPATHVLPDERLWHTWTPGAREAMAPMFGNTEKDNSLFGPDHAVFVNPHLTTEAEGPASITPLIRRWLTRVVAPDLSEANYEAAISGPVFTVDQLVRNIREHAMVRSHPAVVDSVVGLEVLTEGPRRFLRVTVLDTGAGALQTLRPKLSDPFASLTDAELLAQLLNGRLPGWDRGRGFGLSTIAEMVTLQDGASMDLWTAGTMAHVDGTVEPHAADAEIVGTVINARFPLPAA